MVVNVNTGINSKRSAILLPIFFILAGIGVALFTFFYANKSINWTKTTATIVNIFTDNHSIEDSITNVYVDFVVEGKEFNSVLLDAYHAWMHVGDTINIKYNPSNPTEITYDSGVYFKVPYVFAIILLAIGICLLIFVTPHYFKKETDNNNEVINS